LFTTPQRRPAAHQLFGWQHGWPAPPQATHIPFWQRESVALHASMQHGCPMAPQPPQLPDEQVAVPKQASPIATQVNTLFIGVQQPPLWHARPLQQCSPASPQWMHMPMKQ
jgi:hypothetical protein